MSNDLYPAFMLIFGAILGVAIGWPIGRVRGFKQGLDYADAYWEREVGAHAKDPPHD